MLALVTINKSHLKQLNVDNTFLRGGTRCKKYMKDDFKLNKKIILLLFLFLIISFV